MSYAFIIAAFILYAIRYAYSGADNALYYSRGKEGLPDIHDAEAAQEWAAHGSLFCMVVAFLLEAGWSWVDLGGFMVSMYGMSLVGDFYFNRFIIRATGTDTPSWYWPLFGVEVPKLFHGKRRMYEPVAGTGLFLLGMSLWIQ